MEQWKIDVLAAIEELYKETHDNVDNYDVQYLEVKRVKGSFIQFGIVYFNGEGYLGLIFDISDSFYKYTLENKGDKPVIYFIKQYLYDILEDFSWIKNDTSFDYIIRTYNYILVHTVHTPWYNPDEIKLAVDGYYAKHSEYFSHSAFETLKNLVNESGRRRS